MQGQNKQNKINTNKLFLKLFLKNLLDYFLLLLEKMLAMRKACENMILKYVEHLSVFWNLLKNKITG